MQLNHFLHFVLFSSIPLFLALTFGCETAFKDVRKRVTPEMPRLGWIDQIGFPRFSSSSLIFDWCSKLQELFNAEYICKRKIDSNECPNIYLRQIYLKIPIYSNIFVTLCISCDLDILGFRPHLPTPARISKDLDGLPEKKTSSQAPRCASWKADKLTS